MFLWGFNDSLLVNFPEQCLLPSKDVQNVSCYAFAEILSNKERPFVFLYCMPHNLGIYLSALNRHHEIPLIIFPISVHCRGAGYRKYINLNFWRMGPSVLILMHLVTVDLMDASSIGI